MPIIDLMSEIPYAAALTADYIPHRCLFCFLPKRSRSGVRCEKCKVVHYCDENCQKNDSFEHEPECRAYRNWKIAQKGVVEDANAAYGDEKLRLLARIIRRHRRDGGNVDLTTNRPKTVKVRRLSDLMSHREDLLRDAVRSIHLQDYASDLYGYFANTTEEFSPFYTTVDEIEELVGKMCINCFGIPVTTAEDETHIGVAVYLTSSRFDHTCKPNLFMDFEGNRLICRYFCENENDRPDYDKLTVSYGYAPSFAGFTAAPTRHQRQLSLVTRYYFICKCDWCNDEQDSRLSEGATTRLCKACGSPYVFQPDIASGFVLRQSCDCENGNSTFGDCFKDGNAAMDLDKLVKEWCTTFHPTENLQSADDVTTKLEPLRRLAHKYWHPTLNLRYIQMNEALFHAYRSIALSGCPNSFVSSASIYSIPETSSVTTENRMKAMIAGCIAGELTVMAYEKRLEPYETVVARFCFQLAELYELRENENGALKNYEKALKIWEYHGGRGESQSNVVKNRIERVMRRAAVNPTSDLIISAMKNVTIRNQEKKEMSPEKSKDKKIRKKKRKEK